MSDYHDIEQFILRSGCDFCYDALHQLRIIYPVYCKGSVRRQITKPVYGLNQVATILRGFSHE